MQITEPQPNYLGNDEIIAISRHHTLQYVVVRVRLITRMMIDHSRRHPNVMIASIKAEGSVFRFLIFAMAAPL
jgi:hypothetical protein